MGWVERRLLDEEDLVAARRGKIEYAYFDHDDQFRVVDSCCLRDTTDWWFNDIAFYLNIAT